MRTKLSKIALAAGFCLAIIFTLSCSDGDFDGGGSCSAGESVRIGSQTWMKKNLNCNVSGSVCYNNDEANCAKYGRLYNWATAKTVCPSGWHLPSDDEWQELVDFAGGDEVAGTKLKAKDSNGTDEFGFSALPGGGGFSNGNFYDVGGSGYWWSSAEDTASGAWGRGMDYDYADVYRDINHKTRFISVRCVQD
jgi:uncharacterized protein (TIGR02145 family)